MLEIKDLKNLPHDEISEHILQNVFLKKSNDRLAANYFNFNPWADKTILSFDVLMIDKEPVCFGCIQQRNFFPEGVYRLNTRHYLFPKFRNKIVSRSTVGYTPEKIHIGGAIIREQLQKIREFNPRGAFVSRERGFRMFDYFIQTNVNALLTDQSLRLKTLTHKHNICNNILSESCWQYISGVSFCSQSIEDVFSGLPQKGI